MHYRTFVIYNVVGGALWTLGLTYAGYFLGNIVPGVDKYLEIIILGVVLLSISPALYHFFKEQDNRAHVRKLPSVTLTKIRSLVRKAQ